MNWYLKVLSQYADFEGRARRKEFWIYLLIYVVVLMGLVLLDKMIFGSSEGSMGWLTLIYIFATALPSLAVQVRRLHDIDKSGWWILIQLVPLIGWLWFLVLLCMAGTDGDNEYGPAPSE